MIVNRRDGIMIRQKATQYMCRFSVFVVVILLYGNHSHTDTVHPACIRRGHICSQGICNTDCCSFRPVSSLAPPVFNFLTLFDPYGTIIHEHKIIASTHLNVV